MCKSETLSIKDAMLVLLKSPDSSDSLLLETLILAVVGSCSRPSNAATQISRQSDTRFWTRSVPTYIFVKFVVPALKLQSCSRWKVKLCNALQVVFYGFPKVRQVAGFDGTLMLLT